MDNEQQAQAENTQLIYEKLAEEPAKWYARFLLYRGMEASSRSLLGAYRVYQEEARSGLKKPFFEGNVYLPGAWKEAATKYDWKFRAELYDMHQQAEEQRRLEALIELEQAEKERILSEGYALMYKRVAGLGRMAEAIEKSFEDDQGKINYAWLAARGAADRLREYRGMLADIAAEIGDRVKKSEISGKNGGPVTFVTEWGGGRLTDDESSDQDDGGAAE
jgi:hypothetical protein